MIHLKYEITDDAHTSSRQYIQSFSFNTKSTYLHTWSEINKQRKWNTTVRQHAAHVHTARPINCCFWFVCVLSSSKEHFIVRIFERDEQRNHVSMCFNAWREKNCRSASPLVALSSYHGTVTLIPRYWLNSTSNQMTFGHLGMISQ